MTSWLRRFIAAETTAGIVLMAAAVTAVALANSSVAGPFARLWEAPLALAPRVVAVAPSLRDFIDDGLMAIFFLYVGLGIKRELSTGQLASLRRAALPMLAALGGMLVPALFYLVVSRGTPFQRGWGIPTATDIAFAVGVMALLGPRAPTWVKVFITALAIADDVGAVIVIALFYAGRLVWPALLVAGGLTAILYALNRRGVRRLPPYLLVGAALWVALQRSGVHATISGVIVGMAIPDGGAEDETSPLGRLERGLARWVSFVILPLFALANAGVRLPLHDLGEASAHPVTVGIIVGLVFGKLVGIFSASWVAVKLRAAELPPDGSWRQLACGAALGGIGFTMSMFTAHLAFSDPLLLERAKLGIFTGSLVAAAFGASLLSWQHRRAGEAAAAPALASDCPPA